MAFLYHLGEGSSPKSYGINVARLARLPHEVIQLATKQSQEFEERLKRSNEAALPSSSTGVSAAPSLLPRDLLYFFYDRMVSLVNPICPSRRRPPWRGTCGLSTRASCHGVGPPLMVSLLWLLRE